MERIHYFFEYALFGIANLIHITVQRTIDLGAQILQNDKVQAFALCSLMVYSKTLVQLERAGKWFYDQNQIVRVPVDAAFWLQEHVTLLLSNRKLEPNSPHWMNVCRLTIPNDRETPSHYFETYNVNPYPLIDEMQLTFGDTFSSVNTKDHASRSTTSTDDTVVILKTETLNQTPAYKVVLCNGLDRDIPDVTNLQLSKTRLLSVAYNHPMLREPILLEIPREMLVVGNELLSPVFIRRCLEYQGYANEFRLDYWILVIDGSINQFRLSSTEFLWVGVNGLGVGSLLDQRPNIPALVPENAGEVVEVEETVVSEESSVSEELVEAEEEETVHTVSESSDA